MKPRKIIIVVAAIIIVVAGKLIMDNLASQKKKKVKPVSENIAVVFVDTVHLTDQPIYVRTTGVLRAKTRTELFSEVRGMVLSDDRRFNPGANYRKGEILISVNSEDHKAQLTSQRSSFRSLLTSVMPDLKLDYPQHFQKWQAYLRSVSPTDMIPKLPLVNDDQLKDFLTGRNIYTQYYTVRNLEHILSKYTIRAPYNGQLVEALIDPGTVISPGQRLGTFIEHGAFELEAATDVSTAGKLKIGQPVDLYLDLDPDRVWNGRIARINNAIDLETQLTRFYVSVSGEGLKDGMYLQVGVEAGRSKRSYEAPREVLSDGNEIFVVDDSILVSRQVEVVHTYDETVIVHGIKDGERILKKVPPGAFAGMKVQVYQEGQE